MRLPKVLYHTIFSHLSIKDLSNFKLVSKRHNKLVEEFLDKRFTGIKEKIVPKFDQFLNKVAKDYDQLKQLKNTQHLVASHAKTLKQTTHAMESLGNLIKKDMLSTGDYKRSLYNRLFSDQMITAIKDNDYTKFKFLVWQANYTDSKPHIKNVTIDVNALFKYCWVNGIPNSQHDTDKNKNSNIDSDSDSENSDRFFRTSFEFDFSYWKFSSVEFKFSTRNNHTATDKYFKVDIKTQVDDYDGKFYGFDKTNWNDVFFEDVYFDDVISLSDEINWKLDRKPIINSNIDNPDFFIDDSRRDMIEKVQTLHHEIEDFSWDLIKAKFEIKSLEKINEELSEKNRLLEKQLEKYKNKFNVPSNKNTLKRKREDDNEKKADNNKKQKAFF